MTTVLVCEYDYGPATAVFQQQSVLLGSRFVVFSWHDRICIRHGHVKCVPCLCETDERLRAPWAKKKENYFCSMYDMNDITHHFEFEF
jgi:hypothetical protein